MNRVTVVYLDGSTEELETDANVALNGMVLMVNLAGGSYKAIALASIRSWVFTQGKIAIASSMPSPAPRVLS